jgi:hypothetical protein
VEKVIWENRNKHLEVRRFRSDEEVEIVCHERLRIPGRDPYRDRISELVAKMGRMHQCSGITSMFESNNNSME